MEAVKFTVNETGHPFTMIKKVREKINLLLGNFVDKDANASATDTPTINSEIGTITPAATAIAAGAVRAITLSNTKIETTSIVFAIVSGYAGAGTPLVTDVVVTAGQAVINLQNVHAANATDASVPIAFIVF